jgi:phage gp29-like protein
MAASAPAPLDLAQVTRISQPAQRWSVPVGRVTPSTVYSAITAADTGDAEAYLSLAAAAEERYGHYAACLQTRKLSVVGADVEVTPGASTARAARIAADFEEYVASSPHFSGLVLDLLDGIAKGYSVVQPHWDTSTRPWTISRYEWVDPRLFTFDRATLTQLRIKVEGLPEGIEPEPGQFITHMPRTRSGIPLRAGLARPVLVAWMFQSPTLAEWATFAEVFGMPTRIGRYDPDTATEGEISALRSALINLGHDAAAIIPQSMQLEVLDARRPTSGDNVFQGLADYWDKVVSKITLGGTMTSDSGSSLAQAQIHDKVRMDILVADARSVCATISGQLIRRWVDYNYGPDAPAPKLSLCVEPPADVKTLSEGLVPLLTAGLRVSAAEIREKIGFSEPEPDEEIIGGVPAPQPVGVTSPSQSV